MIFCKIKIFLNCNYSTVLKSNMDISENEHSKVKKAPHVSCTGKGKNSGEVEEDETEKGETGREGFWIAVSVTLCNC